MPSCLPYLPTDGLTLKQLAFLGAFRTIGNITRAARAAGVARTSHAPWLSQSPAYAAAFQDAL
jgi:hypothetical protein